MKLDELPVSERNIFGLFQSLKMSLNTVRTFLIRTLNAEINADFKEVQERPRDNRVDYWKLLTKTLRTLAIGELSEEQLRNTSS